MRFRPRPAPRHRSTQGFSLVELSIVVAIIGVVSVLGLEAAANFVNRTNGTLTKERLVVIDDAIARFFKVYGRLPCPALRATPPTTNTYGLEECTVGTATIIRSTAGAGYTTGGSDAGGGIYVGAVPFRALNIPMNLAIDGFGSKINYVVTKNLTVAGGTSAASPVASRFGSYNTGYTCTSGACVVAPTGGYTVDPSLIGMGGIEIRSGVLEQACGGGSKCQVVANPTYATTNTIPNGAAYIIFSNGADRRGGISMRGNTLAACVSGSSSTDGYKVDAQNCAFTATGTPYTSGTTPANAIVTSNIPLNVFYDARFNTGLVAKNFFDDYVIWRAKSQL